MNLFELKDASETNQQCVILTKRIKYFVQNALISSQILLTKKPYNTYS